VVGTVKVAWRGGVEWTIPVSYSRSHPLSTQGCASRIISIAFSFYFSVLSTGLGWTGLGWVGLGWMCIDIGGMYCMYVDTASLCCFVIEIYFLRKIEEQ